MPIISRCYPTEIMAEHNDIGRWGENIAREYLAAKGYAIVESNVRSEDAHQPRLRSS